MLSLPCLMHLNSVFFAEVGASVAHHSFFLRQRLGHLSVIVSPSLFQGEPNCIGQSIPTSLLFSPRFPHRYFMDPLLDSILLTFSWCNFCNLIPQTFISFVQSVSVSFMSNFLSKLIGRASSQATLGHRMGDDLIRGVTSLLDVVDPQNRDTSGIVRCWLYTVAHIQFVAHATWRTFEHILYFLLVIYPPQSRFQHSTVA